MSERWIALTKAEFIRPNYEEAWHITPPDCETVRIITKEQSEEYERLKTDNVKARELLTVAEDCLRSDGAIREANDIVTFLKGTTHA